MRNEEITNRDEIRIQGMVQKETSAETSTEKYPAREFESPNLTRAYLIKTEAGVRMGR